MKHTNPLFAALFLAAFVLLLVAPEFALAASPFTSAATQLKSDASTIFQIVCFIGIMAVGVLCMLGRINKLWLVGCLFGIVLIFGSEQIITWIRGAAGV